MNANATHFFLDQQARRFESSCQSAIAQLDRARDMWEVVRATNVSLHPVLRGVHLPTVQTARSRVKQAAEKRLGTLLDEQLKAASGIVDPAERKKYIGRLRAAHWDAMRGPYASLFARADLEGRRLLATS